MRLLFNEKSSSMADGKKKIIVYADWIDSFEELSDEEAGKLIKHFFRYVNDQEPVLEDRILKAHWIHIQNTLKRDLDKWKNYVEKQRVNGQKGGRPNTETQKTQAFSEKAKKAVSVSDSVSDSVKERDVQGPSLEKSNLFRKPDIPTFEQVNEAFGMQGGTQDMARKFFEKHDATGWYINNSPIKNFASLIPKFIENWNRNNARDRNNTKSKLGAKSGGFGILNEVERQIGLLGPEDD